MKYSEINEVMNVRSLKAASKRSQQVWIKRAKQALSMPDEMAQKDDFIEMSHKKAKDVLDKAGIDYSKIKVLKKYGS